MKLLLGDCIEIMKTLPENSVDSVVTDPPYFLINNGGNGFMSKEWDGVINLWRYVWLNKRFVNNVVALLKSTVVDINMDGEPTVQENVNTLESNEYPKEHAPYVTQVLPFFGVQKKDSVLLIALTRQGLLDSLGESSQGHIKYLEESLNGENENALYVVPILLPETERQHSVIKNVTTLLKAKECPAKTIIFTKTEAVKIRRAIVEMAGGTYGNEYTDVTSGLADIVGNTVEEKKYSATILFPIITEELTKQITLLLFAYLVTHELDKTPENLIYNFFKITFLEVLRVLKPGGHLLSFGGSRTYHRMACAIEDAGFEIRDMVEYMYGSGFPKSLNIGKAVDKLQGNKREILGSNGTRPIQTSGRINAEASANGKFEREDNIVTKGTSKWEGFGTALKPAHEPICMARKPLSEPTVASNVLKWGTGGINVDGCRVGTERPSTNPDPDKFRKFKEQDGCLRSPSCIPDLDINKGRFPANLIHDGSDEVVDMFPNDAARFFYCSKSSKADRGENNGHPCVKPTTLMRYLCKLVTPPNGIILDPFMGSGSTGKASKLEGFDFIGIEMNADYMKIAEARIAAVKVSKLLFPDTI